MSNITEIKKKMFGEDSVAPSASFALWHKIHYVGKKFKLVTSSSVDKFMPDCSNFFALKLILHQDMKTIKELFLNMYSVIILSYF